MESYVYVLVAVLAMAAFGANALGEGYTALCETFGGEYRQAEPSELGYPGWLCTEGPTPDDPLRPMTMG